jgi:hypothetical protein
VDILMGKGEQPPVLTPQVREPPRYGGGGHRHRQDRVIARDGGEFLAPGRARLQADVKGDVAGLAMPVPGGPREPPADAGRRATSADNGGLCRLCASVLVDAGARGEVTPCFPHRDDPPNESGPLGEDPRGA